ncbi:C40 family peptidase [Demequina rhizosphaerae]|uniref:C40 family peptidase n=1 Tax=Demequina rhizosphaerae TaxID=1638985 RepID=UPI000A5F1D7F|nr:C40 family peptidase [Demequina rhizosphaerae]
MLAPTLRAGSAMLAVVLGLVLVPVVAPGASAAEPGEDPTVVPTAPAESGDGAAPIAMVEGDASVTRTATSAASMALHGEAVFTSAGDPSTLPDEGLVATVVFVSDGGRTATTQVRANLTSDHGGLQTWSVPIDRTVATGGRVSVTLGGVAASARYAKAYTSTRGWATSHAISREAGTTWTRDVTVAPAYGRKVQLQVRRDGRWVTTRTVRTRDAASDTVTLAFDGGDSRWYATGRSVYRYRVLVPATKALGETVSRTLRVRPTMAYRARAGYAQPVLAIRPVSGGYTLRPGRNGNKVKAVQRALGLGSRWETMDSTTLSAVARFQRSRGLAATGAVDKRTWIAMGLGSDAWYVLGGYIHPVVADRSTTRAERIEIMIDTAMSYVGSEYVWGGAGRPRDGADCSGIVMQAMYAAGMPTSGTDVARHSEAGFRSTRALYHGSYQHVALSKAKRGDLLFFTPNGGTAAGIMHMGIYLGGGRMLDMSTTSSTAQVRSIHALDRYLDLVPQAVRVFS